MLDVLASAENAIVHTLVNIGLRILRNCVPLTANGVLIFHRKLSKCYFNSKEDAVVVV